MKALFEEIKKIPVMEVFDMTEEGPEYEFHLVVRVEKDTEEMFKELLDVRPF